MSTETGYFQLSRHLGYYAELRASMSLLATQGIGIFQNRHFVVEGYGNVTRAMGRRGTHGVAWLALQNWASQPRATQLLSRMVAPQHIEISDWLSALPLGASWTAQGREWLETWGLDLRMFELDRAARNASSYRPTSLLRTPVLPVEDAARFVEEFWLLLEPQPLSAFPKLDRYLLRRSVEESFRATSGRSPRQASARFRGAVAAMVDQHIGSPILRDELVGFFCRDIDRTEPWPLVLAETSDAPEAATHHLQVISRALLLLRTATGACILAFDAAKLDFARLEFWWGDFGQRRGFWATPPAAQEIIDSWLDVEAAVDDVQRWRAAATAPTFHDFSSGCAGSFGTLSHGELVPMWSFAA